MDARWSPLSPHTLRGRRVDCGCEDEAAYAFGAGRGYEGELRLDITKCYTYMWHMQLHLYLPEEIAEEVRKRAEARGLSVSRFLAELVKREVAGGWPEGYFERVVGSWEGLERPAQGKADLRDSL